jgi:lipoprotein-releasing system ATP-binding protein
MILAKNIHKYFDQLHVLKGVNLHISKGEIIAIVGASGAGKTTLLQILGTLEKPTTGKESELFIDGESVLQLNDNQLSKFRNLKLGFIFQFHQLLPEFTALENVCIPGFIANRPKNEVEAEAIKLLEYLGLGHRISHKPNELSGGQRQRVAVARALVNKPSIILADEPTGNLASKTSLEIMHLFDEIHASGNTVILVTHEEEIATHAHRIIRLRDGIIESDTKNR